MGRTEEGHHGAKEEEAKVNKERASEIARREVAQAHAGQVVAGSGERGKPRRMPRMVSARLDGELFRQLRIVAQQRNTTVSDLLREGAELIIEEANASAQPRTSFTVSGAKEWLPTAAEREFATH